MSRVRNEKNINLGDKQRMREEYLETKEVENKRKLEMQNFKITGEK
jgi:hypothetical protein